MSYGIATPEWEEEWREENAYYKNLRYVIDPNQFDETNEWDEKLLPREDWECRFYDRVEAIEVAGQIAGMIGKPVELEVVAYWGYYGRETVERIMVEPRKDN